MKLARKTGTPLHLWSDDLRLYDADGDLVESDRASELQDRTWELFKDSFGYSTSHAGEIPTSASLYQWVRKRIGKLDVSDDDRELLVQLAQLWGNYTGSEIQRQSLKYVWTEVVCGGGKSAFLVGTVSLANSVGDEYFVNTSLKTILDAVAAVPLAGADVHLSTKVVGIASYGGQGAGRPRVTVETDAGTTHDFDEVVVTLPLGCLKRGKEIFTPPLTPSLTAAIDAISVGHLEKASAVYNVTRAARAERIQLTIAAGLYHIPKGFLEDPGRMRSSKS